MSRKTMKLVVYIMIFSMLLSSLFAGAAFMF
ncbi:stressosome-associated protein Prli42 [Bacillaceae bacterium SIJ1]|nr:stressosome-associated protein Prli42 [Litoribacterium kuwaitense]NGP43629.1 stressosome-associated protein Prli42 [Litoribacterium kuwaitense]